MSESALEDTEYSFDMSSPNEELLEWAKTNLGETEEQKCIKLEELRQMIYEKGDVVPDRTDDSFLIRFLRARKFNLQSAYRLFCNYHNFKKSNPELQEDIILSQFESFWYKDIISVLPYREQNGRRIVVHKIENWDTNEYSVTDLLRVAFMFIEMGLLEPKTQILGSVCIFDLKGISMSHAWQVTPSVANKLLNIMAGISTPVRVYAMHIVFESWTFNIIYNIFKPLLNERMRNHIFFHGYDLDSLHQHIDPKYLPERYGGTRSDVVHKKWFRKLRNNPIIFKELESLGYTIQRDSSDDLISESDNDEKEQKEEVE